MKDYKTIDQIKKDLAAGALSCAQLVDFYVQNIEAHKELNAFIDVWADEAKARAAEIDLKLQNGTAGKLAGLVLGVKSNMCVKGKRANAASKILDTFESLYTATAVQRLIDEDAILIGLCNCDEMAMGASNENSAYGAVRNAVNKEYVPGGSSGGSAVAVQANMCHAALGSDTGGSIRQPAAFTGNVGYKPSYGVVSRWGLLAYASSFDQIGPICKSVADAAMIAEIMSGSDAFDATVAQQSTWDLRIEGNDGAKKFAIIKQAMELEGLDSEVKARFEDRIAKIIKEGNSVEYVDFPYLDYVVATYYLLTTAEASSNLSRYSGLMYGHRSASAHDLESTFINSRSEGFGTEVQRRIMLGTFVLSSDYYDAYYKKAQQLRRLIKDWTDKTLETYDALLSPTSATPAFKIGEKSSNPIAMYLADLLTVQSNIAGGPSISIPMGENTQGLPMGFQLMGAMNEDKKMLSIASSLESLVN